MNATSSCSRLRLADVLVVVAVLCLDLGVIRALYDDLERGLLLTALPTVNMLAAVGYAGLRLGRMRAFAVGFVAAGGLSLVGFLAWRSSHPWTFIRYVDPLYNAIDRLVPPVTPDLHTAAVCAVLTVGFLLPHAIVGVAGGVLTSLGRALASGRRPAWHGAAKPAA